MTLTKLTCQGVLNAVVMSKDVGPLKTRGPRGHRPQVGLQSVQGRQAAVILDTKKTQGAELTS